MRLLAAALFLLAVLVVTPGAGAEPLACVPTNGGGLDYYSQACVDVSDARCPVYHESWTDHGDQRTCVG